MKLGMWIFVDWLRDYHPKPDIRSSARDIEAVRLFSRDMEWKDNTIYIGKLNDFFKNGRNEVICAHGNDMILLDTDDIEAVLNRTLNAFEYYAAWNDRMLSLLSADAMLQDLFDASGEVLRQPVFLLDIGQKLLASTTNYGKHDVDDFWLMLHEDGSMNLEFILELNQRYPKRFAETSLYQSAEDMFPNMGWHQNFFVKKTWIGSATIIDLRKDITQGDLEIFTVFCQYIDHWFQRHIQLQSSMLLDSMLKMAVTDPDGDAEDLRRQLQIYGWNRDDTLMLVKMDASYNTYNIHTHLAQTLNKRLPSVCAVTVEMSVCLLCNLSQKLWEELQRELVPWMKSSKYYGALSRTFTMEDSFYKNYKYASIIAEVCEKEPERFYGGEGYALHYMLQEMQQIMPGDVCHPALGQLLDYDEKHHTEFYHTLYVYLKRERNHHATATELNLHRNSLSYRLRRISELLDVDLEDPMVRLHILISYEIHGSRPFAKG